MMTIDLLSSTPKSSGDRLSIGFFFAIIIPLTFGLLSSDSPLSNVKTQGPPTSTSSRPEGPRRVAEASSPFIDTRVTPPTKENPNLLAKPGPVEPLFVSAACFPHITKSHPISFTDSDSSDWTWMLSREDSV